VGRAGTGPSGPSPAGGVLDLGAACRPGAPIEGGALAAEEGRRAALGARGPERAHRRLASRLLPPVAYLAIGFVAFDPRYLLSTSKVVTCGCSDIVEQTWFLAWTPHALFHGIDPFATTPLLNAPYGANLAANTTMAVLGLLASPITLTLGAVASFNLLSHLAFALSAWAMFGALRRWTNGVPARFLGGLLYGFSPYMVAQGSFHLNLVFVPLFPLLLAAFDELVRPRRWSARRTGLAIGALAATQYFISSELLVDAAVLAGAGLVLLALAFPRRALARARRVAAGLAWALVPLAVLCGYPVAYSLLGPQEVASTFGHRFVGAFSADLLGPLVPTFHQLLVPHALGVLGSSFVGGSPTENDSYLGVGLLLVFFAGTVLVRSATLRTFSLLALLAFALSLGEHLRVDNGVTTITLPFWVLGQVPGLKMAVAARFALFQDLFAAAVVALSFDALSKRLRRAPRPSPHPGTARARLAVASGVVAAVVLVPMLPRWPYAFASTDQPRYFTSALARQIPSGSTVLAYPYPMDPVDFAMLWQVDAGFRFRLIGGYVLTPFRTHGPQGVLPGGGYAPPTLDPPLMEILFELGYNGAPKGFAAEYNHPYTYTIMQNFLARYRVGTVVVQPVGADYRLVVDYLSSALGGPPQRSGGVDVWYHVQRQLEWLALRER